MKSRRRRRRRQTKLTKKLLQLKAWFLGLSKKKKILLITGIVFLILLIAGAIYVSSIFRKLDTEEIKDDEIVVNQIDETVGEGYTNFVLFGGDSRTGDVKKSLNTDSIIIASLNNETKEVKLVSVYRDTLLDMSNGKIQKCNSAYSRGGAKQAINMLNMNLDLDIKKYVTVDFGAVADLIDMLGGIEVNVSIAEYKAVNKYIDETGQVAGKKAKHLTHGGLQTLDGVQATTYARIRKGVGDDYARTERQRLIIQKVAEKAMKADLATLNKIIDKIFPQIATNFTMTEVLSYAKSILKYKIGETTGFPFVKGSGTIPNKGSCVFPLTLKSNVTQLHEFLYGTQNYKPSEQVVKISGALSSLVGDRKADPDSTYKPGNETSETQIPEKQTPETQTPETQTPETQTPETQTPETQTPETQTPETQTPEKEEPEKEEPEKEEPEKEEPEKEEPEKEEPEKEEPEKEEPEKEDPNKPTDPNEPTVPTNPTEPGEGGTTPTP